MSNISTLSAAQELPQNLTVHRLIAPRAAVHFLIVVVHFWAIQFLSSWMHEPSQDLASHFFSVMDDLVYWFAGLLVIVPLLVFDWVDVCQRLEQVLQARVSTVQGELIPVTVPDGDEPTTSIHELDDSDFSR